MKTDSEWVGGRYKLPDDDSSVQPEVFLWLELPAEVIVGSFVVNPEMATFSESLASAMAEPLEGEPRRPSRIRVADQTLARELREVADGIAIIVAPVPELDETFVSFQELYGAMQEPSYLGEGDIAPEAVAELFTAAANLHRIAPWRTIYDKQAIRVDIPSHGITGGALSVIGASGESFGLLLFRSIDDFVNFTEGQRRVSDGEVAMRSVSFTESKIVPPEMRAEIDRHHWTLDDPNAIPMLFVIDAAFESLDPTEVDVRIMTACTTALLSFFADHHDIFEQEEPEVVRAESGGVTITAPYIDQ
ncbi:MAG TPA: hypothetical protein VF608_05700 [Thermoanaerobaculia bacterium]